MNLSLLRSPSSLILIWGVYVMLVFAWLAYREALAAFYCGVI